MELATIKRLAKAAFPDYSGRKFFHAECDRVQIYDLNWSGGTRRQYRIVRLADLAIAPMDSLNNLAPWSNYAEGQSVAMNHRFAVVVRSVFMGRECGMTVHTASAAAIESTRPVPQLA